MKSPSRTPLPATFQSKKECSNCPVIRLHALHQSCPMASSVMARVPLRMVQPLASCSNARAAPLRVAAAALPSRRAPGLRASRPSRNSKRTVTTMGLFGLGVPELVVIAGGAALIFGPSKLPVRGGRGEGRWG